MVQVLREDAGLLVKHHCGVCSHWDGVGVLGEVRPFINDLPLLVWQLHLEEIANYRIYSLVQRVALA